MEGSSEIRELCWQIFSKYETPYRQMCEYFNACVAMKINNIFKHIENDVTSWSDTIISSYNALANSLFSVFVPL